jgi:type IV secretion system protein VirB3
MDSFRDPIFRGCTRPAMFLGVPLVPFLIATAAFALPMLWTFYLLSAYVSLFLVMAYIPVLLTMREVTKRDDQRLRQLLMRAAMRIRQRKARRFWSASSYSPLRYKARKTP